MVVVLAASASSPAPWYAGLGLGVLNKFLGGWTGAVLGQDHGARVHRRLHPAPSAGHVRALKGRSAEA